MKFCLMGGRGRLGNFFKTIFESDGHEVFVMGRQNYDELRNIVKKSDIIIVSIPIDKAKKVLDDISKVVKRDQLVIDFSSAMSLTEKEMKSMPCGAAFVHPLFAPTIKSLKQGKFIVAPIHKNQKLTWLLNYLKSKGSFVKVASVQFHETLMAHIQALAHFNGILLAKTIADSDLTADDLEDCSTLFFRLEFDMISRIFSQTAEMYANIQFHNPRFQEILDNYQRNFEQMKEIVKNKDLVAYENLFGKVLKKLGKSIKKSFDESNELIGSLGGASRIKLGLLGPSGSFSEVAANVYNSSAKKIFFDSIGEVIKAVKEGLIDFGIVPIENSLGGVVAEVPDSIYAYNLNIEKMFIVPIHQCVAGLSDKVKPDIVLSHPQALIQCTKYIEKNFPNAKKIKTLSTSDAFKRVAEDYLVNAVAIGTKLAAEIYNLKVIDEKIEDKKNNKTKFVVISKDKKIGKGKVSSIVVDPKIDRPGLLFDILKPFREENINLSRIESRPSKERLGKYVFHVDLDINFNDPKMKRAIEKIGKGVKITLLGCYDRVNVK